MDKVKQLGLIGGALVVIAVVGCAPSAGQGAASASASADPSPSSPAVGSAQPSSSEPSPAVLQSGGTQVLVSAPAGWTMASDGVAKNPDQAGELGIGVTQVDRVYSDACRSEGALDPIGTTVDDLVRALDAQVSTDAVVSTPTLNGRQWKRVELAEAAGVDRAACRHGAEGPLQIWADAAETGYFALAPGVTGVVLTTDVGGNRIVLSGAIDPAASAADIAEFEAIIGSLRLPG